MTTLNLTLLPNDGDSLDKLFGFLKCSVAVLNSTLALKYGDSLLATPVFRLEWVGL